MLGLSSSCDATVRLTRKASIPEKPGDVKEFVSLSESFQGNPSGRLPRYARNDIKCVARKSIKSARKFYYYFPANKPLLRSVRSTLSLRGAKRRGNLPEGTPHYKTHARYFCTCVEKKGANKQKSEHCRPDNAISKAQLSGTPRDTVYPWGKGAHKQKSEHYCLQ